MKRLHIKSKKGFTIIEVVLVLAIAGLIFMMVFLAVPALQRSQRDTQRSNDMARMVTALQNYAANNRGAIPKAGTSATATVQIKGGTKLTELKSGATTCSSSNTCSKTESWAYFYDKYLLVGSAGATDTFADPDGEPYSLYVVPCTTGTLTAGTACNQTYAQRNNRTFDAQSAGLGSYKYSHTVSVVYNATCQGEQAIYSSGKRKVAILYKKEGGGVICVNN